MELTLEQVAGRTVDDNLKIILPPVQRGLVWNAIRMEVLWDSILRGLPIGMFSVRKTVDRWELMDGQQRSHAIRLAFATEQLKGLCPAALSETRKEIATGKIDVNSPALAPILWIDIARCAYENGDDHVRQEADGKARRVFNFKVTTAANPWGYRDAESETSDEVYSAEDRRSALTEKFRAVGGDWKIGERPLPYEVWPYAAVFPVPMAVIVEFIRSREPQDDVSFGAFRDWCRGQNWITESNWYTFNGFFPGHDEQACRASWDTIVKRIGTVLKDFRIVACEVKVAPKDVGVYFQRMNRAGIVPTVEEIHYCLLKDSLSGTVSGDTWRELDESAAALGISPSRLVSIALRLVKNIETDSPQGLTGELKLSEVMRCGKALADFLGMGLELDGCKVRFLDLVDQAISLFCGKDSVLRWVLKDVATADDGVVLLWFLRLIAFKSAGKPVQLPGKLTYTGLITYVSWFATDAVSTIRDLWSCSNDVSSGLYKTMREDGHLLMPIAEKELAVQIGIDSVGQMRDAWNDDRIKSRLSRIWCGFSKAGAKSDFQPCHGRSLLIFACRSYLQDVFKGYVPGQPQWREQNTPWDIDHVLPQAWLHEETDDPLMPIYTSLLWSIGNALPVPFQINRSKGAQPPDAYYPYRQGEVPPKAQKGESCDVEKTGTLLTNRALKLARIPPKKKDRNWFAGQDPKDICSFCQETWNRIRKMYFDWYETCGIYSIVEAAAKSNAALEDGRNKLMRALLDKGKQDDPNCGLWYVSGNHEYQVEQERDLMHPWVSFGVRIDHALVAVTACAFDAGKFEVGLRKDPAAEHVDEEFGKRVWNVTKNNPSLGRFYNSGWWYYYQSPKRLNSPSADYQVERAYRMFKTVYDCLKKCGVFSLDHDAQ